MFIRYDVALAVVAATITGCEDKPALRTDNAKCIDEKTLSLTCVNEASLNVENSAVKCSDFSKDFTKDAAKSVCSDLGKVNVEFLIEKKIVTKADDKCAADNKFSLENFNKLYKSAGATMTESKSGKAVVEITIASVKRTYNLNLKVADLKDTCLSSEAAPLMDVFSHFTKTEESNKKDTPLPKGATKPAMVENQAPKKTETELEDKKPITKKATTGSKVPTAPVADAPAPVAESKPTDNKKTEEKPKTVTPKTKPVAPKTKPVAPKADDCEDMEEDATPVVVPGAPAAPQPISSVPGKIPTDISPSRPKIESPTDEELLANAKLHKDAEEAKAKFDKKWRLTQWVYNKFGWAPKTPTVPMPKAGDLKFAKLKVETADKETAEEAAKAEAEAPKAKPEADAAAAAAVKTTA